MTRFHSPQGRSRRVTAVAASSYLMSAIACVTTAVLSFTDAPSCAAEQNFLPRRGEAVAVMVEDGPAIDGSLNDPPWQRCPPWPLGACTTDDPQKYKTWAKVLFGPTHVFIGIHCDEPDTNGLIARHTQRDAPTYADDSVEVFLRPDPQQPSYQFVVNSHGSLYDARDKQPSWNSSAQVKAAIVPDRCWTAVLKIPLKELPAFAGDDQAWTMNVYRTRPARGGDPTLMYSWSIMTEADYHDSSQFGLVTGIDVPRRADGVTRTRPAGTPRPVVRNRGTVRGGVTVYRQIDFDEDAGGWSATGGAVGSLTGDAAHGKAFRVECRGRSPGCELPVNIAGSRELKVALLMKGRGLEQAGINVFDTAARDNTTAYGYRYITPDRFTPIVYFLDRFRYNSRTTGFVSAATEYASVKFYAPADTEFTLDNFVIYRGDDRQPPERVTGLTAVPTRRGVQLTWQPAVDNVGAMLYVISRADSGPWTKVAESYRTTWLDPTAPDRGTIRYRVFAVDFEENFGPWSEAVSAGSSSAARTLQPTREATDRFGYADHVRAVHARGRGKVRKNHVTLFGDSLTAATVYPQCARSALGNLSVTAFGYPSMRTSFARDKVHEILERDNPEYICILYGTNNNKAEPHLARAMEDLTEVVRACEARGTVAVLGTIPPRGWTPESAPEAAYNRQLIDLCRRLQIPTAYIFEGFQAAGPDNRRTYLGGDGVHWTGAGMAIAGRAWARAIEQVRFVVRDQK